MHIQGVAFDLDLEVEFLLCPFVYAVFTKLVVLSIVVTQFTFQCFILMRQDGAKDRLFLHGCLVLSKLASCWGFLKTFRSKVLRELMPFRLSFCCSLRTIQN